jgi:hypothetical protein
VLVAACGCSTPQFGDGHLQCAGSVPACPDHFYCASDQRCWRLGFGPASGPGDSDLGVPDDLAVQPDQDLGTPPNADLAAPPDLGNPSLCSGLNVKICDGFEKTTLNTTTWDPQTGGSGSSINIDTTRAYRGHSSLRLHHDALANIPANATIEEGGTFPTGTIYVRVWAYLPSPIANTIMQVVNLTDNSVYGVAYMINNGHPGINDYTPPLAFDYANNQTVPRDRWTCLQMSATQSGTTGDIHIFVDGTEVNVAQLGAPLSTLAGLSLGLSYPNAVTLPAEDMWIDEIIVDTKPTTCAE